MGILHENTGLCVFSIKSLSAKSHKNSLLQIYKHVRIASTKLSFKKICVPTSVGLVCMIFKLFRWISCGWAHATGVVPGRHIYDSFDRKCKCCCCCLFGLLLAVVKIIYTSTTTFFCWMFSSRRDNSIISVTDFVRKVHLVRSFT